MNRSEAIELIKEIISACQGLGEEGIMLMPPDSYDILSHGYQLHIKSSSHKETLPCLKPIVDQHNLAIVNDPEKSLIIIYKKP